MAWEGFVCGEFCAPPSDAWNEDFTSILTHEGPDFEPLFAHHSKDQMHLAQFADFVSDPALAIAGVPLNQIQQWLGHSTINMTMRYAHLAPGSGANLIAALETRKSVAAGWQQRQTEETS